MTQAASRAALWEAGILAPWYLKPYQMDPYELMLQQRFPFVEMSRRIGKTTSTLVYVQEELRQGELKICRWAEPWKYQAREIVIPEMDRMQESCPTQHRFKYYKTDSFYELPRNGARIYLRGVNEDKGESARGSYAHIIVADEFGSWREPKHIVDEIFIPQLLSTNGQLIKLSTPPKDLGHLYYEDRERAIREHRFMQKTIWAAEGQLYSRQQILDMCDAVGGPNSPAWLREFLCQPVADPELLVIPEFEDHTGHGNVLPDDHPRPEYLHRYVSGDSGFDDNTAFVFGYYDFLTDTDVIEDEILVNGRTTGEIVAMAKLKEMELWGSDRSLPFRDLEKRASTKDGQDAVEKLHESYRQTPNKPHRRAFDTNKQSIFDLFTDHKYAVSVPPKGDKHAAIHEARVRVGSRKLMVKERCWHVRRQMKVGMWKDERHSDFQRSDGLGHLDAIAAAVYFGRIIDRKLNPYPAHPGASPYTHHIPAGRPQQDHTEAALTRLLGGPRGRR